MVSIGHWNRNCPKAKVLKCLGQMTLNNIIVEIIILGVGWGGVTVAFPFLPYQTEQVKEAGWKRQLDEHIFAFTWFFFWNDMCCYCWEVTDVALTPLSVTFTPAEGICNMSMDSSSMTMPMSDPNAWATAMNNLGMPPIGITGQQLMPGNMLSNTHSAATFLLELAFLCYLNVPLQR